ncbi:MAG: YdcF family protein [Alphaproteobacteria bacterium]|nr:YdcF family protein [Alphaproteobacteria bacterium]
MPDWLYPIVKQAFELVASNGLYWLLLALALLAWARERRGRAQGGGSGLARGRRGVSLIALLGVTAAATAVLSLPIGPHLAERALAPSRGAAALDGPIADPDLFIAVFSGGVVGYGPKTERDMDAGAKAPDLSLWQPKEATVRRVLRARDAAARTGLPLALSGGRVPDTAPPEADVILNRLAFPPDAAVDRTARNTFENAQAFAALAEARGWTRAVVATDRVHLRRAAACLRAVGIEPAAMLPAEPDARLAPAHFLPSPAGLAAWRPVLREAAGLLYYLTIGRIEIEDL